MASHNQQLQHHEIQRQTLHFPLCLLANDMGDPMNVGSLFRLADALGVEKLILTGDTPVPPHPKIKKTSRSTEKSVPYEYHGNAVEQVRQLKQQGYVIISLEITTHSIDLRHFSSQNHERLCLILGSENTGVSQALLNLSDYSVHIPMFGQNSSMNVVSAAAIAAFELSRHFMP